MDKRSIFLTITLFCFYFSTNFGSVNTLKFTNDSDLLISITCRLPECSIDNDKIIQPRQTIDISYNNTNTPVNDYLLTVKTIPEYFFLKKGFASDINALPREIHFKAKANTIKSANSSDFIKLGELARK